MIWRPDTSHTVIDRLDRLSLLPQLLARRISQQDRLLQNRIRLQVAHTDCFLAAVDVGALDDGVLAGTRGDGDFDRWVGFGEAGERVAEEEAEKMVLASHEATGIEEEGGRTYFMPLELPAQSQ